MSKSSPLHILNLVENLNQFLLEYIETNNFQLYSREEVDDIETLTHIIVESVEQANEVTKEYNTNKNNIEIICFGEKSGIRDLLLSNGRLLLNENLKNTDINTRVLNKYFSSNANIHLDEEFSQTFEEFKQFNIVNHLITGEFIDEVSLFAFEKNFNLVSIRSFVDHALYYFTYLKQSGLAGVPFEFEYAANEETFVLSVNVSVKNFVAEYILDSFGQVNSTSPVSYLLGIVSRSCDFLDITFIEEPGKLSFTGFFGKDKSITQGLSFSNIKTATQIKNELELKISKFKVNNDENEAAKVRREKLEQKSLPGGLLDNMSNFDNDSSLKDQKTLVEELISHMIKSFESNNPDADISEFEGSHFEKYLPDFHEGDLVGKLKDSDKKILVERIQKNNLVNAFDDEVSRVRNDIRNDSQAINQIENAMSEQLAKKVADHVDLSLLNNILGKDEEDKGIDKGSVFGEFKPSVPQFDTANAFEDLGRGFEDVSFNTSSLMSELESQFGQKPLEDTLAEIKPLEGNEEETISGFEKDSFDDLLNKLPGSLIDKEGSQKVGGAFEEDDFAQQIGGLETENEGVITIGGGPDDPEGASVVKGGKEEADDFVAKIGGMETDKESPFVASFSGGESNSQLGAFGVFSGDPSEQKNGMKMFVKNTLDNAPGMSGFDVKVKAFVHKEAPARISNGLEKYAEKLGKTLDSLSQEDIDTFQNTEMPEILSELLTDDESIQQFRTELDSFLDKKPTMVSDFQSKFKNKLESKVSSFENVGQVDGKFVVKENDLSQGEMNSLIHQTMKETFQEEFKFNNASPDEIKEKEDQLIKDLSHTLEMPEQDVREIVKGAADQAREQEKQIIADKIYQGEDEKQTNSKVESELINKLKTVEEENKKLKTNLSALQLERSANDKAKETFDSLVDGEIPDEFGDSAISDSPLNEVEKLQVLEQIKEGGAIDPALAEKLAKSLENENKVIEMAKKAENELKKAHYAAEKKDALFKQELTKAEKSIKAKEMILDKAKESMKNLMGKKEKELLGLKNQVNDLNQKLKNDQSTQLRTQVKALSREKETLIKTAEVYKNKLESMAKNVTKKAQENNNNSSLEEKRMLERQKNQLENRLNVESKQRKTAEEKLQTVRQSESKLKTEVSKAQTELKTTQSQLKLLKEQNAKLVKSAASSGSLNANKISKEAETLKAKNTKLQDKINDLTKKLEAQSAPVNLGGNKVSDLSHSQAQHELEKSIKEVSYMKDQNQKLQQKIEELQKKYQDAPIVSAENSGFAKALNKDSSDAKSALESESLKAKNEELSAKLEDLTAKLQEAELAKNSSGGAGGNAKEKRLEQSVKKMNQELTKARTDAAENKKEMMKFKAEVTGLKNQLAKAKKDLEKAQKGKAGPKKKVA